MAIEKNSFKVVPNTRLDSEFSSRSREESMSSEDVEFKRTGVEVDEEDEEYDDCDSGAGSDEFDLLELGETGEEFCQIGDQTCSIPFELYDLSGLEDILSMDVWNDVLTEDERLNLTKYLPDMDQEHFMRTMKDLFTGSNFHFGVPINKLFDMLKGGLCEPRVSLYRQGLGFFQKHRHYHVIRKHQNTMVNNLVQIRDAWSKCRGYSIEEKIRVLNIMKSQKSLMYEKMEELETDSSEYEESTDVLWSNTKMKDRKQKRAHYPGNLSLEPANFGKNHKGTLKVSGSSSLLPRQTRDHFIGNNDEENAMYDVTVHRDHSLVGKKYNKSFRNEESQETFMGLPMPLKTDPMQSYGRNKPVNQLSDIKVLTAKPTNSRYPYDHGKKLKYPEVNQKVGLEDALQYRNPNSRGSNLLQIENHHEMFPGAESFWHNQSHGEPVGLPYRIAQKKGKTVNGGRVVAAAEGMKLLAKGEETESDSSEQFVEDDEDNPLMRSKWAYPSGASMKSGPSFKKPKLGSKYNNKTVKDFDGSLQMSRKNGDFRDKQKGKTHNFFDGDGHFEGMFQMPIRKMYPSGKKLKGEYGSVHINDYVADNVSVGGLVKKGQIFNHDRNETMDARLLGCNSGSKKRKVKDELIYIDDQRRWMDQIPVENVTTESTVFDTAEEDAEMETKILKKTFPLITPSVHTGFSFSIIHLLSAVRMAMVTLLPEDTTEVAKNPNLNESEEIKQEVVTSCDPPINPNVPSLTVKEIVNRVKSNPGDPCILETQEPLQDLVRGVLKIFASKTAPLGAKGWKSLVLYKKSVKTWSWMGPVSLNSSDNEIVEEVTSPESWGLPYKMLVKLVDSFANWLKSGQETLQQIGSLPAPPLALMQANLDERERFRDLRAQKSLNTINPTSEEVRDYFRKEEVLRYLIPDRAFAYTAVDGKKSTVAPSRKGAGKPTSKARDHFMLKKDRPPHVTILCLVRDAAARLPGSIGTRADVCTLIRDSQYIVEDVSDAQVNQVVSGALDRLHYERDPCVQFDGERKLWVYLHREREEEDFEDDGTSSTKKWKRQKKEPGETAEPSEQQQSAVMPSEQQQRAVMPSEQQQGVVMPSELQQGAVMPSELQQGVVTLAYQGTTEQQGGFDLMSSDLNIEPPVGVNDQKMELLCEKNSVNQDLDGKREGDVELLNTSVS